MTWDITRRRVAEGSLHDDLQQQIAERQRAEQALLSGQLNIDSFFQQAPTAMALYDSEGRLTHVNKSLAEWMGVNQEEHIGCKAFDMLPAELATEIEASVARVLATGVAETNLEASAAMPHRSDEVQHGLYAHFPIPGLDGKPVGVGAVIVNTTELKHAEEALRRSEVQLRLFVEYAPAGVAMFDRDLCYLACSRRWITDYRLEERNLIGKHHYEVFPEIPERWKQIHRRCLTGASDYCEQDEFERSDGSIDYIRWEIQPWWESSGRIGGLVFCTENITDRVLAEKALRDSKALLDEAQRAARFGNWNGDLTTGKISWSDEVYRIFGFPPQSFTPHYRSDYLQAIHPDDRTRVENLIRDSLSNNHGYETEHRVVRPDNSECLVRTTGQVMRNADGVPVRLFGTVQDITQERHREEQMQSLQYQLAHANRVATLGELASGIAHELNQPLAAIGFYAEGCLEAVQRGTLEHSELRGKLTSIAELSDRCGQIIRRMRAFATKQGAPRQVTDLRELVHAVVDFLAHDLRQSEVICTALMPDEPLWVLADGVQIQQVLVNLVRNAIEAQLEPSSKPRRVEIVGGHSKDKRVYVSIRDHGPGICESIQQRLFEPFFTTRASGLGMGLNISQTIMNDHGGEITFRTEMGGGATFVAHFPVAREAE